VWDADLVDKWGTRIVSSCAHCTHVAKRWRVASASLARAQAAASQASHAARCHRWTRPAAPKVPPGDDLVLF
jgi:hypothetical protein